MNAQNVKPKTLEVVLNECQEIARTRGIAVLVPGDLHVWGRAGGNRSDLFVRVLEQLPFHFLVTNGDLFEGRGTKHETKHDAEVLAHIQQLDELGRWIPVRGNHDRRLFVDPHHERATKRQTRVQSKRDLSWLRRLRVSNNTLVSVVEGELYFGPSHDCAHEHRDKILLHPGSHDLLVLSIAGKNILFEHGDVHDRFIGKLASKDSLMTKVASTAYDILAKVERTHVGVGVATNAFKRQVSMWRGVCESVALGATEWANVLGVELHGTVSGHTHYPLHATINDIPHVNVGSFRGQRPSFAIITEGGELLPPFVIKADRIN